MSSSSGSSRDNNNTSSTTSNDKGKDNDHGHNNDLNNNNNHLPQQSTDRELAQVFAELARGESTAHALETHLTALESKIDLLLASVESPPPTATARQDTNPAPDAAAGKKP